MRLLHNLIFIALTLIVTNCNLKTKDTTEQKEGISNDRKISIEGNYVDSTYEKRAEGFDWTGISVHCLSDTVIHIKVRSRADIKGPICSLDAQASKARNNVYRAIFEGKPVLFSFADESLTIKSELVNDSTILALYCSSGSSLAGAYKKINGDLDQTQVDQTSFIKNLTLNGISFAIKSKSADGKELLTITPSGLTINNDIHCHDITGQTVLDAQIADMNNDGYPEILVYTQSRDSYGNIIGYSVNKGKSLSQIYFPPVGDNPKISLGYQGHDSFTLVGIQLIQKFPVYRDGDTNAYATGKHREIIYELTDGENSRILSALSIKDI